MGKLITKDGKMVCPRCKVEQNILAFTPLQHEEEFAEETAPPIKCKQCNFVFAPIPDKIFNTK